MVKLGLFLAMLVLSVGAVLTVSAGSNPADKSPSSGIWGITLVGPTAPVCRQGQPCEAGRSVALRVSDAKGGQVFYSDKYGLFMVGLPAGHYVLVPILPWPGAHVIPSSIPVDVYKGQFTEVIVHVDTGLR